MWTVLDLCDGDAWNSLSTLNSNSKKIIGPISNMYLYSLPRQKLKNMIIVWVRPYVNNMAHITQYSSYSPAQYLNDNLLCKEKKGKRVSWVTNVNEKCWVCLTRISTKNHYQSRFRHNNRKLTEMS